MFYVHLSIANYYSAFIQVHEAMQDSMVTNLASGIKDIVELYGPPAEDDGDLSWVLALLTAGFGGGAALTMTFTRQLTGLVGALGLASGGMQAADPAETDVDLENNLETWLGEFYDRYSDNLEDTILAIFGGDFSGFDDWKSVV